MQNKHNFRALDKSLRDLMGADTVFGGIPATLGGDFVQILPVIPQGTPAQIIDACIQRWDQWTEFT